MVRPLADHPPKVSLTIVFFHYSNHSARGHTQNRATPLPLQLYMKVHMKTGDVRLVNMMAEPGLSISYDHLRRLSTALAYSGITLLEQIVVVEPFEAIREKFATRVIDNIITTTRQQQ